MPMPLFSKRNLKWCPISQTWVLMDISILHPIKTWSVCSCPTVKLTTGLIQSNRPSRCTLLSETAAYLLIRLLTQTSLEHSGLARDSPCGKTHNNMPIIHSIYNSKYRHRSMLKILIIFTQTNKVAVGICLAIRIPDSKQLAEMLWIRTNIWSRMTNIKTSIRMLVLLISTNIITNQTVISKVIQKINCKVKVSDSLIIIKMIQVIKKEKRWTCKLWLIMWGRSKGVCNICMSSVMQLLICSRLLCKRTIKMFHWISKTSRKRSKTESSQSLKLWEKMNNLMVIMTRVLKFLV